MGVSLSRDHLVSSQYLIYNVMYIGVATENGICIHVFNIYTLLSYCSHSGWVTGLSTASARDHVPSSQDAADKTGARPAS